MYNFIDVTETQAAELLPAEALQINGVYIENVITGYRTLTVEGREALSAEISSIDTDLRDGSAMKGKRYPARTIRVTYQIKAASDADYRDAYNKLASILNVTDARLIFNDEQDKFFTGTPSEIGAVQPGKNAVVGTFDILCLDPFKYSVAEYEATAERGENSVVIDYGGTYKSFPVLQAELITEDEISEDGESVVPLSAKGDCGYIAFFNEDEKIIQLGAPEEVDGNTAAASQTLINQKFDTPNKWAQSEKKLWETNKEIPNYDTESYQTGSVGVTQFNYGKPLPPVNGTLGLGISTIEKPYISYLILYQTSTRAATYIDIIFTITAWLGSEESYFGNGYKLVGILTIGGKAYRFDLHGVKDYWEGKDKHSVSRTIRINVVADADKIEEAVYFEAVREDGLGQAGVVPRAKLSGDFPIPKYVQPTSDTCLTPSSYGTGSKWHGPSIRRIIPADAGGVSGAKDFAFSFANSFDMRKSNLSLTATDGIGVFQAVLVSGSGDKRSAVIGVELRKNSGDAIVELRFFVNKQQRAYASNLSRDKKFDLSKTSLIQKNGNTVKFDVYGIKFTFVVPDIADVVVNEIVFNFYAYGSTAAATCWAKNGLRLAKFVKHNCSTWNDIPNKFSANDVVEADCKTGTILLNGNETPGLGALGNDWESFCLTPGVNQVGFVYSDWVEAENAPKFKVKYREVFL